MNKDGVTVKISKKDKERLLKIANEATETTPKQVLEAMNRKPTLLYRLQEYQAQYDYYSRKIWDMISKEY